MILKKKLTNPCHISKHYGKTQSGHIYQQYPPALSRDSSGRVCMNGKIKKKKHEAKHV